MEHPDSCVLSFKNHSYEESYFCGRLCGCYCRKRFGTIEKERATTTAKTTQTSR